MPDPTEGCVLFLASEEAGYLAGAMPSVGEGLAA